MRAERMWTYPEIAEQVLRVKPITALKRIVSLGIPRFHKPHDGRSYVRQSDVNRLATLYWMPVKARKRRKVINGNGNGAEA